LSLFLNSMELTSFRQHAVFNGIIGRKTNAEQYKVGVISVDSIQITIRDKQTSLRTIHSLRQLVRQHAGYNGIIGRKTNAEQYKVGVISVDSIQIAGCDKQS